MPPQLPAFILFFFILQPCSKMTLRGSPSTPLDLAGRPVPMDRCWSVPLASALSAFLLVMNSSCYGFLYVLFMKKYGISHAEAAWPSSALVIAGSSVRIVVSQLQDKVSVYHITLVGGLLASLGLVASAFTPDIVWMSVTFGVLHGAGIGTALLGFSLYILLYFEKYSGTAFAIMWIARATSGMAGTPLLWHLANMLLPRQERIVRFPLRHARRAVLRTGSAARVAHVAGSDAKKRATRAAILRSGHVRVAAHKGAVCGLMTGILLHYLRQMCLLLFRKHCRHLVTGTSR
nr:monocarboxylate transporter 6-like isoform X1 [Dermacentor andersoni]